MVAISQYRHLLLGALLVFLSGWCQAQPDSAVINTAPEINQQRLEDFLQNAEDDTEFEFNTIFEDLENLQRRPLDLNMVTESQLQETNLLTDVQIINLLNYRQQMNGFMVIYELQAIPGFDLNTVKLILPYVRVGGGLDDFQVPLRKMISSGRNEVYLRWQRVLEPQKGYQPLAEGESASRYLGDPNQLYVRYRHQYNNRLSYGFTAEKDRGEEFFTGSNRKGFDFYSAHFYLRDYNKTLKSLALGDFTASLGQGLVLFTGFGYGKSAQVASVKRGGSAIRQYTSVNEANYLRGGAFTLAFGPLEVTGLASYRRRDANLVMALDTLDTEELGFQVSSLGITGLHRTPSEIEDRNAIRHFTGGGSLKYRFKGGHVAFNGVHNYLDKPLVLRPQPYNRFYFQGQSLTNLSLDYSYRWRNFNFFGETANSDNGAIATVNGLLAGLNRRVDLAVVFRHFPRNYQALFAVPFAETTGARNETGVYVGLEVRPHPYWIISTYYDSWQHPWLRFNVDAPSTGHEYRLRLTYYRKRSLTAYLEVRDETKDRNVKLFDSNLDDVVPNRTFLTRFHLAIQLSKALEWRSRMDFGFADNPINNRQQGFGIYQDFLYRPSGSPWSFTTRFALFDTDGFVVRFYNFENGLLYNFAIPAYYNQGSRFYFNLRYKGIRNMTIEARIAQTYWADQPTIGSGLEETNRPTRTELAAQIKYQF